MKVGMTHDEAPSTLAGERGSWHGPRWLSKEASDERDVGESKACPGGKASHRGHFRPRCAGSLRYGAGSAAHAAARIGSLIQLALSTHEAPK